MGAQGSKENHFQRSVSERGHYNLQSIERERFGSFGKRGKGAAKKRDVRTINSSDLCGPPNKTTNGAVTTVLHVTTNGNHNNNLITGQSNGLSPRQQVATAAQFNGRSTTGTASIQKQRSANNQNQPPTIVPDNNNKNGSLTTTPVKANGKRIRSNNESPVSIAKFPLKENNRLTTTTSTTVASAISAGSLQQQQRSISGTPPTGTASLVNSPKTKLKNQPNVPAANHNRLRSKESSPELVNEVSLEKKIVDAILLLNQNKFNVLDEAQNAKWQQEVSEKEVRIERMETDLQVQSRGVEALGVLVNYLVHDYDAFSNPTLRRNYELTSQKLTETRQHLDETCKSFRDLESRLDDQEMKYQTQADHLAQVTQTSVELKTQLASAIHERDRLADELELCRKNALGAEENHRVQTEELESRLNDALAEENELRERVMASEVELGDRLKAGAQREKELATRLQKMEKEFEVMRIQAETREQELMVKLDVVEKEVVLRSSWNGSSGTEERAMSAPAQTTHQLHRHSSPLKATDNNWHVEAESLRSVLDLKMNEAAELRRQNQDLQRAADELALQQIKASSLESKVEDLQFQLNGRIERESELVAEVKSLSEKLSKESKCRTRLSIHNEELQWKLKNNSEKHQREVQELSKSYHENSIYGRRSEEEDADLMMDNNDVSPPVSPKIKGIVETSDAVSWILEMDDDSPVQMATRAIRRVGSFRSSPTALKRSKSSQSPMNPLSQSASATSLMRQCSAETSPMKGSAGGGSGGGGFDAGNSRTRSKSMSVKPSVERSRRLATMTVPTAAANTTPVKKGHAAQVGEQLDTSFRVPIYSSSPYKHEGGIVGGGEPSVTKEEFVTDKKRAVKNLSFTRTRAASFGAGTSERSSSFVGGLGNRTVCAGKLGVVVVAPKDQLPQEAGGEAQAMILNLSDGEDILSVNSSLTTSTSSSASVDEETTAEKDRTAISVHQSQQHSMERERQESSPVEEGDEEEEEGDDEEEEVRAVKEAEERLQEIVFASLQKTNHSSHHSRSSNRNKGSNLINMNNNNKTNHDVGSVEMKWSPTRLMSGIAMEEEDECEDAEC